MRRLSTATLHQLPECVERPSYDRDQSTSVLHIGVGAFNRAHQLAYFDALLETGVRDWMVEGASLRSDTAFRQLHPQDGLFTLTECDGSGRRIRLVGALKTIRAREQSNKALIAKIADPSISLLTLTITEKGYLLNEHGQLDPESAEVIADLGAPSSPSSAPGVLVAGLRARRAAGSAPLTILSCDNLSENGVKARASIVGFARALDDDLAAWIDAEIGFPSSMVDRITPATTQNDIDALGRKIGLHDEAMVQTEPFRQWVIEDAFRGPKPVLDQVGVQFTNTVSRWEEAKLRLLNGAHSTLAYSGGLAGIDFVHEAISEPSIKHVVDQLWQETSTTLMPIDGLNIQDYKDQLLARFENPALHHKTRQIAIDGSRKIPQRLLEPVRACRAQQRPCPALLLSVSFWIRWQAGVDDTGQNFEVEDPCAAATQQIVRATYGDWSRMAKAFLSFEPVFGTDFKDDHYAQTEIANNLRRLFEQGILGALGDATTHQKV